MANLVFTITVDDSVVSDIRESVAKFHGWTEDSGETQSAVAQRAVLDFIKNIYREYKAQVAKDAAAAAADAIEISLS